jgi:peroxiredoxin
MAETLSSFQMSPGAAAPDFTLPDADGVLVSRSGLSGPHGLLVVFACNHCPFVVHLADALGELARVIAVDGVHTVAINSNDVERYPQDGPAEMKEVARKWHWDFPYLIDSSQVVAKAHGATCTPDFFLFTWDGKLSYAGQFDDSRPRSGMEPHGGDLREAVRRMLDGEEPLARPYPSSGCGIKWKPGNEPVS